MEGEKLNRDLKIKAKFISPLLFIKMGQSRAGHTQVECYILCKSVGSERYRGITKTW